MKLHKQNFLDAIKPPREQKIRLSHVLAVLLFLVVSVSTYEGLRQIQDSRFKIQDSFHREVKKPGEVLGEAVQDLSRLYSLAWLGAKAAPYIDFVNRVLGDRNSVKTYVILFQNNSEIRPSGGFLGSYALLKIVGGKVKELEIPGQGFYGLEGNRLVSVAAPKPLTVFSPLWQIWNSNWFPDFPTSAQKLMWFYERSGLESLDGVVSISPVFLERLLVITGPVDLPEFGTTITAENAYRTLQEHVEFEYDKKKNQPKEILSVLAPKLIEKLSSLNPDDYVKVLKVVSDLLSRKQILAYFNDEQAQQFIGERNWDGRILEYDGAGLQGGNRDGTRQKSDYVMVVHTNVGGGKTDYVVETRESLDVRVRPDGTLLNTISITRSHKGDPQDKLVGLPNIDYVRVYAPKQAKLVETEGFGGLPAETFKVVEGNIAKDEWLGKIEQEAILVEKDGTRVVKEVYGEGKDGKGVGGERHYTSFGNWMIVKPGETTTAKITYEVSNVSGLVRQSPFKKFFKKLMFKSSQQSYSLIWQKQPGMDTVEQTFRLVLPKGMSASTLWPKPDIKNQNELIWQRTSDRDHVFVVGVE